MGIFDAITGVAERHPNVSEDQHSTLLQGAMAMPSLHQREDAPLSCSVPYPAFKNARKSFTFSPAPQALFCELEIHNEAVFVLGALKAPVQFGLTNLVSVFPDKIAPIRSRNEY